MDPNTELAELKIQLAKSLLRLAGELAGPLTENLTPPTLEIAAPRVGDILRVVPGVWTRPGVLSYAWYRVTIGDTAAIPGADQPEYTVTETDIGARLFPVEFLDNSAQIDGPLTPAVIGELPPPEE